MSTSLGSQPTGTPLGLKQEAGTLTPLEEEDDEVEFLLVLEESLGAEASLSVGETPLLAGMLLAPVDPPVADGVASPPCDPMAVVDTVLC